MFAHRQCRVPHPFRFFLRKGWEPTPLNRSRRRPIQSASRSSWRSLQTVLQRIISPWRTLPIERILDASRKPDHANRQKHHRSSRSRTLPPDAKDCSRLRYHRNRHGKVSAPGPSRSGEGRALPRRPPAIWLGRRPRCPRRCLCPAPCTGHQPSHSLPGKKRNLALYACKCQSTPFPSATCGPETGARAG